METQNLVNDPTKHAPPPPTEEAQAEEMVMGEASPALPPRDLPPRKNLILDIHNRNVEAGWWPEGRSMEAVRLLIVSELVEAFEEVRDNKPPVYVVQEGRNVPIEVLDWESFIMNQGGLISYQKPEGIVIELADTLIRCFDLVGFIAGGADMYDEVRTKYRFDRYPRGEHIEAKLIWGCVELLAGQDFLLERLVSVIDAIEDHCTFKGFDIDKAIDIKMKYNLTRPHRHGGKKY